VALALSVAIALGSVAGALAQPPKPSKSTKPPSSNVTGTVLSASSETVVVSGRSKGKDAEWTFAVMPTTNIRKGSKSIVAGDLKAGDTVQVRYVEEGGKATAQSIVVKSPVKTKDAKKG
jgi:hypothetical protein